MKIRPIKKIRFIEPGNLPYRFSLKNFYTYDKFIRAPSTGLLTLSTVVKKTVDDTLMYSESISKVKWDDVFTADIVFIGIFTFNASRGYEIAQLVKQKSDAIVVMGGLHASLNYTEAVKFCDYVLLGEGEESIIQFINSVSTGQTLDFEGLAYRENEEVIFTGHRKPPENIDIIPDRNLLYRFKKMSSYNTIWPQVHASRGCPYNCDYCTVVRHFGRKVRMRSPENIVEDMRSNIEFHKGKFFPRLTRVLWLTDDNFFTDRDWVIAVLKEIIKSKIKYKLTVQARYEVGFDDEILDLMKQAGFFEVAMGIEFLEDESFEDYHKKCRYDDIVKSIQNIQKHGLNVRGLFIVGADNHTKGIGNKIADFVIKYNVKGVLIQSMYFVPGTPVYDTYKDKLIHHDWSKFNGNVVHYPKMISPADLQKEIIFASKKIYSFKRLLKSIFKDKMVNKELFAGEFFWQISVRRNLNKHLASLPVETIK